MKLTREAIQRMISQKQGTSNVTVINQEGGGGGGGVTLGPLLTSLNAEAMPTAEGYLHWTGSAWAFDTPTGGDPVDLTPYALKTWVQTNYASNDDIADFITKDEADTYYAALSHTHANYLPLSAGSSKPLTGSLYFSGNSGINWSGGVGMLACTPESGWTGISSSQWGVGALSAQGVIRSNANDILHYRNGTNYKIWDAYNFTPSDYLPLTGGTVESLTVTNGLDADSITVESIVNSDTLAEYLDQDASDDRYLQLTGGTLTGNLVMNGAGVGFGPNGYYGYIDYSNSQLRIGSGAVHVQSDGVFLFNGDQIATQPWVTAQLGSYLPLTGGTVNGNLNVKGTIQAQDSNGNNKVMIYGSSGNIRAEKVYIGGSTSGYEAATHNWVASQGYQANVIETVKVAGTALTPTNKAVDIPAATSDGSTFGVVAIGTGFTFDEDRLCVDTSTFATRTWADGRYLPLTAGENKPLTGSLYQVNGAGLFIKDTGGTGRMAVYMNNQNQFFVGFGMRQGGYEGYFDSNIIYLRTGSTGTTMTLDASHNVGIGTTSPAYKLDVSGVIKATEGVMVRDANGNRVGLGIDGLIMMYPSSGSSASAYVMSFEYDASGSWPMVKTKFSARPQVITGQSGSTYTYTNVALTSDLADYLPLAGGTLTGSAVMQSALSAATYPARTGHAIGMLAQLNQHTAQGDNGYRGGVFFMYGREQGVAQDKLEAVIINCLSEYKSNWYNGDFGLMITADDVKFKGASLAKASDLSGYLPLTGGTLTNTLFITRSDSSSGMVRASNSNGSIELLTYSNRGVYDRTAEKWLIGTNGTSTFLLDGNVGIGTNAPDYKLDVSGVIRASEGVMVRNGSSDAIGFDPTGLFFNKAQEGGSPIPASIFAFTWDSDAQKVLVSKDGNMIVTGKMAVGTTAFDGSIAKLQVGGNMFATGSITSKSNYGNVSLGNGNISATNLYISTVVFGSSNNDPAIYIGNGHVYARNSQGQTTMII